MKLLTKKQNRFFVLSNYVTAFLFTTMGLYFEKPIFYAFAMAMLLLGMFRKYVIGRRLKG